MMKYVCKAEVYSFSIVIYILFAWKGKVNITHVNVLVIELSIS